MKQEVHHRADGEQKHQKTEDGASVVALAGDGGVAAGVQRKVATDCILRGRGGSRILRIGEGHFGGSGGEADLFVHLDVYVPGALFGERFR